MDKRATNGGRRKGSGNKPKWIGEEMADLHLKFPRRFLKNIPRPYSQVVIRLLEAENERLRTETE